jgi:hypothetical protein
MTRTKKKSQPADIVNSAWEAYFSAKTTDIKTEEELRREGWVSIFEFCKKMNLSRSGAAQRAEKERLQSERFRIYRGGALRSVLFLRLP